MNCWKAKTMIVTPISSQVTKAPTTVGMVVKGSETRSRAEAVTDPRAPSVQKLSGRRYSPILRRKTEWSVNSSYKILPQYHISHGARAVVETGSEAVDGSGVGTTYARYWVNCWKAKATVVAMPISSQATKAPKFFGRVVEGSETRERAEAVISPRVPSTPPHCEGEDIVRYSDERRRVRLNSAHQQIAAYNTVEEYNQIQSYGQNIEAFIDEGDLPESTDSQHERKYSVVKYLGTTRSVTHVMSLVRPAHGNVIANETVNGTMYLLRALEKALFTGDSSLSSIQFDGFKTLIENNSPAANIIDMRGAPLTEDALNDGSLIAQDSPNFGQITHLYLNPKAHADVVKAFYPKSRYDLFGKPDNGMVGLNVRGWTSPAGNVMFEPDVFIDDGGAANAAIIGDSSKVPSAPTIAVALAAAPSGSSQFAAADAGAYRYKVVAANRYGKAAAVVVTGSPVAVAAGDAVTFSVTEGATAPEWYEVYRSEPGGAADSERLILRVPWSAGPLVITDVNANLPYTTYAIGFQMNLEAVSFKQLAPMVKIPLATVDTSIRWMQLLYGVPVLYTPGKIILYKNIGRDPGAVG